MTTRPKDVAAMVTSQVLDALRTGTIPWRQPWSPCGPTMHRNAVTNRAYRGSNRITLPTIAAGNGYRLPLWLSFRQAQALGGSVRKGERSAPVVYWHFGTNTKTNTDGTKTMKRSVWLRYFAVFNVAQCDLPAEVMERFERTCVSRPNPEPGAAARALRDQLTEWMAAEGITMTTGTGAFYSSQHDRITMPDGAAWTNANAGNHYTATLAHECSHATGHERRLNRKLGNGFGSKDYAREELVAELAASFLACAYGMDTPDISDNRDAYIASWLKALENDPRAVVVAAGAAERAAEYVTGRTVPAVVDDPETVQAEEPEPEPAPAPAPAPANNAEPGSLFNA
jgi:antirestriction protein ArdC